MQFNQREQREQGHADEAPVPFRVNMGKLAVVSTDE
jgi:hypothetical protein